MEGATTRQDSLSREHQGPGAILNAVERLAGGYGAERSGVEQDLGVAQAQLRDYQAGLGLPFPHAEYLDRLAALRDQFKARLSGSAPEKGPGVAELAGGIKTLKAAQVIDTAPERVGKSPAEVFTGGSHPHWLELLGYQRFSRA